MNPTCLSDCQADLPVVSFTDCNPEVNLSEIEFFLLAKTIADDFTDESSAVEWNTRLSQTSTSDNAIRLLRVSGDMPKPTDNEVTISGQRKMVIDRTFVANGDIDETNQSNYEFVRKLQCGGNYKFWFVTRSGHLFGGRSGITCPVKADLVLDRGENGFQKFSATATWKSKFMPERKPWVMYGLTQTLSFDTVLTFDAVVGPSAAGITGTVLALNASKKFEFNLVAPRSGTPASMTIKVAGASALVIDFPTDYAGLPFRYTHSDGSVHTGNFTNGTVDF